MPQTQIIGGGNVQAGTALAVDPTFQAARVALRPLDHAQQGQLLGHYSLLQLSGATVSLSAGGTIASFRWTDPSRYGVLLRVKAGWVVTGAITLATPMDASLFVARSFTTDFTTNATSATLAATKSQAMRSTMANSLQANGNIKICTTASMTGLVAAADSFSLGGNVWVNQPSGNATVTQAVGVGGAMTNLYDASIPGTHPIVLAQNEGVLVTTPTAGPVTGTVKWYVQWEWAEVALF